MEQKILKYLQDNFDQTRIIPKSFDAIIDNKKVHIESMSCFAIAAYPAHSILIGEFSEDDGHFFAANIEHYGSGWLLDRIRMYKRMQRYLRKNCNILYYHGMEGKRGFECGFKNWKN